MSSTSAQDYASRYLEDLLSFFGLNTKVDAQTQDSLIILDIPSTHLNGFLIGHNGQNLYSLQHILNLVLKRQGFEEVTAKVDVAGYKKQQEQRLEQQAAITAEEVLKTEKPVELAPMNAHDRRVIHQAIGETDGVTSESVGEGRDRRVVIQPQT